MTFYDLMGNTAHSLKTRTRDILSVGPCRYSAIPVHVHGPLCAPLHDKIGIHDAHLRTEVKSKGRNHDRLMPRDPVALHMLLHVVPVGRMSGAYAWGLREGMLCWWVFCS